MNWSQNIPMHISYQLYAPLESLIRGKISTKQLEEYEYDLGPSKFQM